MLPLITLDKLGFSAPDGKSLFQDLTLAFGPERTGIVGRNGAGKTTLLRLIIGEIAPTSGVVSVRGRVGVLRQTLAPPEGVSIADTLGVAEGWTIVAGALAGWKGCAIVASHDRGLLGSVDRIVEINGLGVQVYGGAFPLYEARKAEEKAALARTLDAAERDADRVKREAQTARERKARRDRAGARYAASGSAPKIFLGMMAERAENSGGAQNRLAERKADAAASALAEAQASVERVRRLAFDLPPTGLAPGKRVATLSGVGFTPPGGAPVLSDIDLTITGPERIAISGPNGSGKSTLVRLIAGELQPTAGERSAQVRIALLDQQTALLGDDETLVEAFRRLNPEATENAARAALARFLFRAKGGDSIVNTLSGGERLRAALAATLMSPAPPQLLILDEPTNRLDIESVEALEAALRCYDGALVVISHDGAFLKNVGVIRRIALSPPRRGPG